jgi:hypothetical protein
MPYEKLYFAVDANPVDDCHLVIHITRDYGLYVEIGTDNGCDLQNIILPKQDAEEIVRELAEDLGYVLTQKSAFDK